MRRPTQEDLIPASPELGCFVFAGSYAWFFLLWFALPPTLRVLSLVGPAVLLVLHLVFVLLDAPFTGDGLRRLSWRLAFTAALLSPLGLWYTFA